MGLQLLHAGKYFGEHLVFKDVSIDFLDRGRYGLIGPNGAGKTTLLKVISGELELDEGEVLYPKGMQIGYLRQDSGLQGHHTILEEMEEAYEPLKSVLEEMQRIEGELETLPINSDEYKEKSETYTQLQNYYEIHDGYHFDVKIQQILNGMNFGNRSQNTKIALLSGGEKTRLGLAKILLEAPEFLILDEPTNHLDFITLNWLEEYLKSYHGTVLIVSHDRYFLNQTITETLELDHHRLTHYKGNYSRYLTLRKENVDRQQKEYDAQQEEIKKMEDYIQRNIVRASTSKMAKSRRKTLEHMELIEKPDTSVKKVKFRFELGQDPYKELLKVKDLCLEIPEKNENKVLCPNLSFHMERGEKIGIIGKNGVGKSTFLKVLMGQIPYKKGKVEWGQNVKISYYEQETLDLHPEKRVIDELWDRNPHLAEFEIRSKLGSVGIIGDEVFRSVGVISGGEKAKLKFAAMSMQPSNLLILDEPTNHLDLPAKELLEEALGDYGGSMLFVSHDRYLLTEVPTKIAELTPEGFIIYPGNYEYYLTHAKQPINLDNSQKKETPSEAKEGFYRSKKQRSEEAALKKRYKDLEREIEELEEEIQKTEMEMASQSDTSDYTRLEELSRTLDEYHQLLEEKMASWEEVGEKLSL